jgi:hypothetical protein
MGQNPFLWLKEARASAAIVTLRWHFQGCFIIILYSLLFFYIDKPSWLGFWGAT